MKKNRIIGIIMMIGAMVIGAYNGIWQLLIQPVMELIQTYNAWKFEEVALDILKVFIIFPMLMIFVFVIWKLGEMLFLEE